MIEISHLTHCYPAGRKTPPFLALDDLTLSVPAGCFCVVIGPNGSGKSTLFKILSGVVRPSGGTAALNGADCIADAAAARRAVGVVFQSPALDPVLTVRENLALFGRLHRISGKPLAERIAAVTAWTDIVDRLDSPAGQLSGGQQRQAELAKCLIPSPPILLLDEPTTGLDPAGRRAFQAALRTLQKEAGLTILMTTHVFDEAEDADRVVVLRHGRLIADDTPAALRRRLGTEMIVIAAAAAPEALARMIRAEFGVAVRLTDADMRIEDLTPGRSVALVGDILSRHGASVASIAIKQPSLEDVFLSLATEPAIGEAAA